MSEKRTRFLGIRVTEQEYAGLKARCEGRQLATWMRKLCLDARPPRARRLPSLDPALLRQLAGIGNNLNQIARKVNAGNLPAGDRVQIVVALAAIDRELSLQQEDLTLLRDDLSRMNGKTWGVTHQKYADGRRYLIMPKGTKPLVYPYDGTYWIQMTRE